MHNLSCENEFYLHENEKRFPEQRLSTHPRFETDARGNSQTMKKLGEIRCIMGDAQVAYRLMLADCKFNKICFQNGTTVERTNKNE